MSITITVRPNGTTSGGTNQNIPGDGEIDTKAEAEAALTFLPDGSTNTVVVGERAYTRAQLIEIRDRSAAPATPAVPAAAAAPAAETVAGDGASHGFYLQGKYAAGLGDKGHSGGGVNLGYVAGVTLLNGRTRVFLDPSLGLLVGHSSSSYTTPGGEPVSSAFTNYGGSGGLALRVVPNILNHRLFLGAGPTIGIGGFSTADSTTVSTPTGCTPGDFGRQCTEPGAGPTTGNAGTQGLMNFDQGSSRGTSGAFLNPGLDLNLGVDIVRGDWGNLQGTGTFNISQMILLPSDGHSFSYTQLAGLLGLRVNIGGGATEVKPRAVATPTPPPPPPAPLDRDGDGVADSEDKCPEVAGTKENAGCPAYEAKVVDASTSVKPEGRFAIAVEVGAKSEVTVQLKDAAGKLYNAGSANVETGQSVSEFRAPSTLTSGKYKLVIAMKDAATKVEKVEEREIAIVERIEWTVPGSFAPGQPPTAQDVRVVGQPKLEGVSYVIVAFDKDGKQVGEIKVTDKPGTIEDKKGTRIAFKAPDINGKAVSWQKDINYRVGLINKDGNLLDVKSFEIGQAPPPPKGGKGPKKSSS